MTYGRSTALSGAHIVCHLCPVGVNRILIEEPPYGDARSFGELLLRRRELHGEVAGLGPVERAERLEAEHRGVVVPAVKQAAVRAALREARGGGERREPGELAEAIRAVLLREVRQGTRITHAVAELARLMGEDPSGYAFRLAGAMADMEAVLTLPPEQVATMMVDFYGRLDRDERTLWRIWRQIPRATLAEARTQGEAARG